MRELVYDWMSSIPGKALSGVFSAAGLVSALAPTILPNWWGHVMIHSELTFLGQMLLAVSTAYWFVMWLLKPSRNDRSAQYVALGNVLSELIQRTLRRHQDEKWESLKAEAQTLADRLHGFDKPSAVAASNLITYCKHVSIMPAPAEDRLEVLRYSAAVLGALCKGRAVRPKIADTFDASTSVL